MYTKQRAVATVSPRVAQKRRNAHLRRLLLARQPAYSFCAQCHLPYLAPTAIRCHCAPPRPRQQQLEGSDE